MAKGKDNDGNSKIWFVLSLVLYLIAILGWFFSVGLYLWIGLIPVVITTLYFKKYSKPFQNVAVVFLVLFILFFLLQLFASFS